MTDREVAVNKLHELKKLMSDAGLWSNLHLIDWALALLTPRVLALDELSDRMTGWLEYMGEVMPVIGGSGVYGAHCFIDALDRALALVDTEYRRTWRVWTMDPTAEEREAVKWDG